MKTCATCGKTLSWWNRDLVSGLCALCAHRKVKEQKETQETAESTLPSYPCPECAREMERGYVTSQHSMRWSGDEATGSFFLIAAETLTPGSIFRWRNPKCVGWRCRQCGLVLLKEWRSQ
jgi:hypothetical protein